jgi:drug/metabolite transporter (DMT)-like permease
MKSKEWGAFILLSAIWGSSFLFIKIAVDDLMPFTLVTVRLGLATVGLWVIVGLSRPRFPREPGTILLAMGMGFLSITLPFVLITWGETTIDSGVASVLNSSVPLFSLVIAHFLLHDERFTWLRLGGLATGFLGVALIFSHDLRGFLLGAGGDLDWPVVRGQLAVVAAAFCYALSAVLIRRWLRNLEPMILAALQVGGAWLFALLGTLLFETPLRLTMSGKSIFALLWLGLLGTCLAYLLYFYILQAWGATRATLVTYVVPMFGVALGALVLDEPVDWHLLAGFALIVAGIALVNRGPARASVAAKAPSELVP